jgi:cation diffusion facilitator CzcD-associated flavoprotein CzcO
MALQQTHTVVVGASISGLACAACLQKKDIPYIIIEKQGQAGAPWRHHYERLHLHTNKRISNLPYKKFERATPRYPSRQQVVDYLESYQKAFDIHPLFNNEVISIKREDDHWITITNSSSIRSKYVIMATEPMVNQSRFSLRAWKDSKGPSFIVTIINPAKILKGKKYW